MKNSYTFKKKTIPQLMQLNVKVTDCKHVSVIPFQKQKDQVSGESTSK